MGALAFLLLADCFISAMLGNTSGLYDLTAALFVSIMSGLPMLSLLRQVRSVTGRPFICLVHGLPIGLQSLMLLKGLLLLFSLSPGPPFPAHQDRDIMAWLSVLLVLELGKLLLLGRSLKHCLVADQAP